METLAPALAQALSVALGKAIVNASPVAGGCIHRCYALQTPQGRYFLKRNEPRYAENFTAEAEGLGALRAAAVRAPEPIAHGTDAGSAWLVLEFLSLTGDGDPADAGRQLALLHATQGPAYGWPQDNFIGLTPQRNGRHEDWSEFWVKERLSPQLELARQRGPGKALDGLAPLILDAVPRLLAGHQPAPSLLHGDLWSGNSGFLADGAPVLFDPAPYYGDPEADLAMTELFGGFPPRFYAAYRETAGVDAGYGLRKTLYNLYHVLNHANLFGGGYVDQAKRMIEQLLAANRG